MRDVLQINMAKFTVAWEIVLKIEREMFFVQSSYMAMLLSINMEMLYAAKVNAYQVLNLMIIIVQLLKVVAQA